MKSDSPTNDRGGCDRGPGVLFAVLWILALAVCAVLTAANLYFGDLNQDEGWYLYAARQVSGGQVPYRDFAFSQGPVMVYAYSLVQPLVAAFGLAGGRLATAMMGIAAALGAALLASRLSSPERRRAAALAAFVLTAVNVYQSYFCTIVKTYSLCALLLILGFLALSLATGRRGPMWAAVSGALLVLAAGTRISADIVLPAAFLVLLFRRGKSGFAWLWFGLGAGAMCCVVFLPFLVVARDNFVFWLLRYHSAREAGSPLAQIVYKAGFVSRVVQAYFVASALFAGAILFRILRVGSGDGKAAASGPDSSASPFQGVLVSIIWLSVAGMTLVHFCAPFPYDDYQAAVFPLFAAGLACMLLKMPASGRAVSWLLVTVFLLCTAAAFSSPINQSWVVRGRDRIWWRLKEKPALVLLREAGSILRGLAGKDRLLLTQDIYLAVESGLSVPPGLEMGPFSYYPGWDSATAARHHVLSREMLRELIRSTPASVAAFSGYGLAIRSPGVEELSPDEQLELRRLVLSHYAGAEEIQYFGQDLTTLTILVKRPAK